MAGRPSLAAVLREHGFATGGFHSNPWLSTHFGYGQEYDIYNDNLLSVTRSRSKISMRLAQVLHLLSPYLPGDQVTEQAVAWIKQQQGPFFAWIHYMDVHGPYRVGYRLPVWLGHLLGWPLYRKAQGRPEAITASEHEKLLNRYEAGVHYADRMLGTLRAELESSGRLADTLVVITADHGEAFREHGRYVHGFRHPFDEVMRVPLVICCPGQRTVARVDGQTELTTIVPTVLEAVGLPIPDHVVGCSAVPWLQGKVAPQEPVNAEAISSGAIHKEFAAVSLRTQEWKYILRRSKTRGTIDAHLYHLTSDPEEQDECSQRCPEVAAEMSQRVDAHVQRVLDSAVPEGEELELPGEVVARLRALGYID